MSRPSVSKLVLSLGLGILTIPMPIPAACGEAPRALLQRYRCDLCHGEREARTGPAYLEVSEHYRGDPGAVSKLSARIRQGWRGTAQWHMPPHPEISEADARTMAKYIVSVRE